jgi:TctA family transporter
METLISNLGTGFAAIFALQPIDLLGMSFNLPTNIVYCFLGALIGTLIGVLPGLGPITTIAMLLPATYALPPLGGLIMLAGIYYGAQYGGSTTAILVNLPGETSSVVTTLDGYQMARRGRGGVALTTAAVGSFFAGCVGVLLLAAFAVPLTEIAFQFGPAEYLALMVLGLVAAVVLASGPVLMAIAMVILGLLFGMVGMDINSGDTRYTFGIPELSDGVDFVVVAMGVFGLAEVLRNLERKDAQEVFTNRVTTLFPTRDDWKRMVAPVLRGTALGAILGILPGGGAALASFGSYALEKKISRNREEFGHGAIEGVAAPESANNASAQTSFIPLLTLGIPPNATMALMVGAMMIHNIQPGPQVMTSNPSLFWGLVVSMFVGNAMLVLLNLPLVGMWVKLLAVPYRFLYPAILAFACIGVYSMNNNVFDVYATVAFGVLGYLFYKLECEGAPLLLGLVLGPLMEENFRRALLMSEGHFSIFIDTALSLSLLVCAAVLIILPLLPFIRSRRQAAFQGT